MLIKAINTENRYVYFSSDLIIDIQSPLHNGDVTHVLLVGNKAHVLKENYHAFIKRISAQVIEGR